MIPVFVINLARSPERRAFMSEALAKAGVTPEFVAAVDARACRSSRPPRALSGAETALILSHRKAWRLMLRSGAAHVAVLEDDAHVGENFAELVAADWSAFDFDLVKLETLFHRAWIARRGMALGGRELRRLGAEHLASAGYVVSRAGARKMLRATRTLAEPVDHSLFGRQAIFEGRVVAYQLYPAIVVQDNMHPDERARRGIATTLHESDRVRLAEAAKRAKPKGLARFQREAKRLIQQARQALRISMQRTRVPWR